MYPVAASRISKFYLNYCTPDCREHDHSANQEIPSFYEAQNFVTAWLVVVDMVMNKWVRKILGIT